MTISSPFDPLVGTSYVPDDEEVLQIKTLLSASEREIVEIDAEMSRIMATYDELGRQRQRIMDKIQPYQQFIALSRRIPDDILQDIFHSCLPESGGAIMSINEAPLLFTRVSRKWRRIALSTPTIWASIYVPVPPSPSPFDAFADSDHSYYFQRMNPDQRDYYKDHADITVTKRVEMIRRWCERAKECPLSITFYDNNAAANEYGSRLLSAITPFSRLWKTLCSKASTELIPQVAELTPSQVPCLEVLEIDLRNTATDIGTSASMSLQKFALFDSPILRQLTLHGIPQQVNIRTLSLQWTRLTHISITQSANGNDHSRYDADNISWILRICRQIISFSFVITTPWNTPNWPSHNSNDSEPELCPDRTPIILPHLRHLDLQSDKNDEQWKTVSLDAPALQNIRYLVPCTSPPLHPSPLHLWLQHTHTSLRRLETDIVLFVHDDLVEVLRLCPDLEALVLCSNPMAPTMMEMAHDVWHISDNFLQLFYTPNHAGEVLCPKMVEFHYAELFGGPSEEGILAFIRGKQEARSSQTAQVIPIEKLSRLYLYLNRPQTIPLAERVNPYIDAGMDLHLDFSPWFRSPPPQLHWKPDLSEIDKKLSPSYQRHQPWRVTGISGRHFHDNLPGSEEGLGWAAVHLSNLNQAVGDEVTMNVN